MDENERNELSFIVGAVNLFANDLLVMANKELHSLFVKDLERLIIAITDSKAFDDVTSEDVEKGILKIKMYSSLARRREREDDT